MVFGDFQQIVDVWNLVLNENNIVKLIFKWTINKITKVQKTLSAKNRSDRP